MEITSIPFLLSLCARSVILKRVVPMQIALRGGETSGGKIRSYNKRPIVRRFGRSPDYADDEDGELSPVTTTRRASASTYADHFHVFFSCFLRERNSVGFVPSTELSGHAVAAPAEI